MYDSFLIHYFSNHRTLLVEIGHTGYHDGMKLLNSESIELLQAINLFALRHELAGRRAESEIQTDPRLAQWLEHSENILTPFEENDMELLFRDVPYILAFLVTLAVGRTHRDVTSADFINYIEGLESGEFCRLLKTDLKIPEKKEITQAVIDETLAEFRDFSKSNMDIEVCSKRLLYFFRNPDVLQSKLISFMTSFSEKIFQPAYTAFRESIEQKMLWYNEQLDEKDTAWLDSLSMDYYSHFYKLKSDVPVFISFFLDMDVSFSRDPDYAIFGMNRDRAVERDRDRDKTDAFFKAMADSKRVEILRMVKQGRRYGRELASHFKLTPATMFHHLRLLLTAGLLDVEEGGKKKLYYTLNTARLEELLDAVRRNLLE